ncbi:phosphoribosylformylglycinamidine synthase, glutamine amidotransferase subunit [hydrocarbon metagenome]|uniref:Phosphoribosylformylglycinamidine synthase, glutamine amidotransferase subunit n=1 Tax=hydrocarbon metagenome TaxID=938273 RepID=A0A0W8FY78_9ZZZZ
MKPTFGIVTFPGSNCDYDAYYAVKKVLDYEAQFIWHKEKSFNGIDAIILPGGFSYGDYLRTGAIAKFSPIMEHVINFAEKGGIILGICNGFQILLESGLLPGTMQVNESLKFVCKDIYLKVENRDTPFTNKIESDTIKIPIKHGEGNYYTDVKTVTELEKNGQIVFRYASKNGKVSNQFNPNGSISNIAGIMNTRKNVMGLMPHPENACDPVLRKTDGQLIFKSIAQSLFN